MKVVFTNTTDVDALRLSKIVGNDPLRPAMQGVYVDFKNKCLVATDAHVLASFPIDITECDADVDGVIVPVQLFNKNKWMGPKVDKNRLVEPEFVFTDMYAEVYFCGDLAYRAKYISGKYPNWSAIMPNPDNAGPVTKMGVEPKVVKRLFDVLSGMGVKLYKMTFFGETKVVLLESSDPDDKRVKALFMPRSLGS